jgi:tRNA pseudouridine55 synthase
MGELLGVLAVDKPKGLTSTEVLNRIKKRFGIARVGHTGTLDPFAEGLLLLLLGKATRLAEYYQRLPKRYIAVGLLGVETDTYDITGNVTERRKGAFPSHARMEEIIASFKGEILQVPPPFSAKKIKGRRAYKLARKGVRFELKPVKVKVYEIRLLDYNPPRFTVEVKVSGGTYIRSLIRDIGLKTSLGATTESLKRTAIGNITLDMAHSLEEILNRDDLRELLLPPDVGLDFPKVELEPNLLRLLKNGVFIPLKEKFEEGTLLRVYSPKGFVAIGRVVEGKLKPEKVFL